MKISILILSALLFTSTLAVLENNPIVPGRYSGLTYGKNVTGIWIEAVLDPLCDATAYQWPIFSDFLNATWLGSSQVKDLL